MALAALALLLGVGAAAFGAYYGGKVHPGVRVLGADLGGKTRAEALSIIDAEADAELSRPVALDLRGEQVRLPARTLGVTLDGEQTAKRALEAGRSGGFAAQWRDRLGTWRGGKEIAPAVSLDADRAAAQLRRLAPRVDQPVRNAALSVAAAGPVVSRSQVGLDLDVSASVRQLPTSMEALYAQSKPVQPVIRETAPAVMEAQLEAPRAAIASAWTRPAVVSFREQRWTLPASDVRRMTELSGKGAGVRPVLNRAAATEWVRGLARDINRPPSDARVRVQPGDVRLIPHKDGFAVRVPETVARLQAATFGAQGRTSPAVTIKPPAIRSADLKAAASAADSMVRRPLRLEFGRESWSLTKAQLTDALRWRGEGKARSPYIEPAALQSWVGGVAKDVNRAPQDARIAVDERGARVVPERPGVAVQAKTTIQALQASIQDPRGVVGLRTKVVPVAVRVPQLRAAAARADVLVGEPVRLRLDETLWTAESSDLREWLRWSGTGAAVRPSLDGAAAREYVAGIAAEADTQPRNAVLSSNSGGASSLIPAKPGLEVDVESTTRKLLSAAASNSRLVAVEARSIAPSITDEDLQPALAEVRSLLDERLYLKMDESRTWWLDPFDLVKAVYWTDDAGADTDVYVDRDALAAQIRAFVAEPPDVVVDYEQTAADAAQALESGETSVAITYRDKTTPAIPHVGNEAVWGGSPPARWIDINLYSQSMAAYEGGTQVRSTLVTTGRPELPTPTGTYNVMAKLTPYVFRSPWPKESPWWYPDSPTTYALRFQGGGYYIHDAPWRGVYGPGTNGSGPTGSAVTGSHGCVNVPYEFMEWLYSWVSEGTAVVIH